MPNTTASEITHLRDVDTHLILSDFQDSSKDLTEKLMQSAGGLWLRKQSVSSGSSRLYISLQNAEKKRFTFVRMPSQNRSHANKMKEPREPFFSFLKRVRESATHGLVTGKNRLEERSNFGRSHCIR